jgi:hypothetical protein
LNKKVSSSQEKSINSDWVSQIEDFLSLLHLLPTPPEPELSLSFPVTHTSLLETGEKAYLLLKKHLTNDSNKELKRLKLYTKL